MTLTERAAATCPLPIDLVRLGNVSLFMPTDDNLYNLMVPENCKHFTAEQHEAAVPVPVSNAVTDLMFIYADMLYDQGIGIHHLDLGAWVGDNAIRFAKHAQQRGAAFLADCFDPSHAGMLIPFNAELNGVADRVRHWPVAISPGGGQQIFAQAKGHSDSGRLLLADRYVYVGANSENSIVQSVRLGYVMPIPMPGSHLLVTIDLEGIDAEVVRQNTPELVDATLVVEFTPGQAQYSGNPAAFIAALQISHTLFDIYYLPRPIMCMPVGNPKAFVTVIHGRPWGYTDVLAVPRSLPGHDAAGARLTALVAIGAEHRMA